MATTLATRQQSAAIRQRMKEIRSELPYDVDDARLRVKQLSDWKYHMSQHSVPILTAAVIIGYLLVPRKHAPETVVTDRESAIAAPVRSKRGLLGGIVATAASLLLRQATSLVTIEIASMFLGTPHARPHTSERTD